MSVALAETMQALSKEADGPYVFPGGFEGHRRAVAKAFRKAVKTAGLADFRFHDCY